MAGAGLIWDLLARDQASPAFLRVAGAADKAAASTGRATKGMAASVAGMGAVGAKLTKTVTLPLLAIGAVSVDQAMKYQKSLNTIAVATDQTSAQLATTSKGLMSIAKSTGTSLSQLSAGLYTIEKGGLRGTQALAALKAAAQGAKAENVDLATATQALSSVMASYGSALSDPVKAENEIIRGAGLAKTTMQDFANSLSNVVPIASSLGIGFDQVAGAIATMTQHGETAQRATENLGNLITNLAGQNNVASQALQQLGVNTIDLSEHLGSRGLVGSLNVVLDHIAKYSKGGVVVTSAFKQAATATASLRTELDAMPPALKKASAQFDAGTMSYKDYYSFVKSLGGQQFVLGKNFIATEQTAKGFNNQLKNGNSTTKTLAATLQKALGGVTGMRVALMLSGQSADTFAKSTASVKKAAGETKGDVLGWAKTQDTLAVKLDKAKASLQVMAVEIGTALIPAVSKLADAGAKAAHWVDGLSGTQKTVLLWTAGILAALGPVFAIGGRLVVLGRGIGVAATGIGNKLASIGSSAQGMSAKAGTAVRGLAAAMGGAAIGTAFGTITRNSSTAVKSISALGSAAAGAAIGFGTAGPLGAVIGGLAGGLSSIIAGFGHEGDAAQKAKALVKESLLEQKQVADQLYQSLISVNGAFKSQSYKNDTLDQLRSKNLLEPLTKGGLDPSKALDIVLGKATDTKSLDLFGKAVGSMSKKQVAALNAVIIGAGHAEKQWELYQQAQGRATISGDLLAGGLKNLGREFTNVKDEGFAYSKTVSSFSAASVRNTEALKENLQYLGQQAGKQLAAGKSVQQVTQWYNDQKAALANQLMLMGANGDVVNELIKKYDTFSRQRIVKLATATAESNMKRLQGYIDHYGKSNPNPKIAARVSEAEKLLRRLQGIIDALHGKTIYIYTQTVQRSDGTAMNPDKGPVNTGVAQMPSKGVNLNGFPKTPPPAASKKKTSVLGDGLGAAGAGAADTSAVDSLRSAADALRTAGRSTTSTASELHDAAQSLYDAAKTGKASASTLAALAGDMRQITKLGRERDKISARLGTAPTAPTAYDRLGTAKQNYSDERSNVKSAVTGTFDIGNFTSPGAQYGEPTTFVDIKGALAKAVANAHRFVHALRKLAKEGLNKGLLAQLAAAGPGALPQALALASATPKQLSALNGQYSELNKYGGSAGKFMADQMYGAGVNSAQALVNGLKSKESALNKAIRNLASGMIAELRKSLDMHSPSRKLFNEARLAFTGYEDGIKSKYGDIGRAAHGMGNRSVPTSHMSHGARGGYVHIEKQELHVHYPEGGDLRDGVKQLARMTVQQMRAASQGLGK